MAFFCEYDMTFHPWHVISSMGHGHIHTFGIDWTCSATGVFLDKPHSICPIRPHAKHDQHKTGIGAALELQGPFSFFLSFLFLFSWQDSVLPPIHFLTRGTFISKYPETNPCCNYYSLRKKPMLGVSNGCMRNLRNTHLNAIYIFIA